MGASNFHVLLSLRFIFRTTFAQIQVVSFMSHKAVGKTEGPNNGIFDLLITFSFPGFVVSFTSDGPTAFLTL